VERVARFRRCGDALRDVLLLALKPQVFAPGLGTVQEGEVGDAIRFISDGTVEVTSEGGTCSHGTLESGDYFGDLSMMFGERRTPTARAKGYCDVLLLSQEDFERIKQQYPESRDVLKRISSKRSGRRAEFMLDGVVP
jgi:CPA1 family monovalent cation:H+ antiporter